MYPLFPYTTLFRSSVGRSDAIAVLRVRSGLQVAEIDVGIGGQGPERLDDRPGATADTPGYLGLRCALVPPTHPDLGRGVAANREVERLMHARVDRKSTRLNSSH